MKNIKYLLCAIFLSVITCNYAQEVIPASGGDASSTDGSVSYSVGQILYTTDLGSDGSVAHGVQQAYEISVTDISETNEGIQLEMSIYPNPTLDQLNLSIENKDLEDLSFALYDMAGKLLMKDSIEEQETGINMEDLERGTYLLVVSDKKNRIKTFNNQ
jgi:hypothetical protein